LTDHRFAPPAAVVANVISQWLLWWFAARHLMRPGLLAHRAAGGRIRSPWRAAGIGLLGGIVWVAFGYAVRLYLTANNPG
jgi:hypothetical protein